MYCLLVLFCCVRFRLFARCLHSILSTQASSPSKPLTTRQSRKNPAYQSHKEVPTRAHLCLFLLVILLFHVLTVVFFWFAAKRAAYEQGFLQGRQRGISEAEEYYKQLVEKTEEEKAQELKLWQARQQEAVVTAQQLASKHDEVVSIVQQQQQQLDRQRELLSLEQKQREEIERAKREAEQASEEERAKRVEATLRKLQGEKVKHLRDDKELPCLSARQQVIDCYGQHPHNPLKCVSYVNELLSCAKSPNSNSKPQTSALS